MRIRGLVERINEDETAAEFVARLESLGYRPERCAGGWLAFCPAHDDGSRRALSIREGDHNALVLKCHGGCQFLDVVRAVGDGRVSPPPVTVTQDAPRARLGPVVATYPYTDAHGELVYEVRRHEPKDFRPWLPGASKPGLGDTPKVLYMLPHVLAAIEAGLTVHVVDGEKDANAIIDAGGIATCAFGGAGAKWEQSFTNSLRGARVVVVSDKDKANAKTGKYAGQDKALSVLEALHDADIVADIVYPAHGKDAYDHLEAGLGLDEWAEFVRPITVQTNPQLEVETTEDDPPNPLLGNVHMLDLDELLRNPPPPIIWTWEGYLERGTLAMLHGDGGLGKSMIGFGLAVALAKGARQFLDRSVIAGPALYLDAENAEREIRRRAWNYGLRSGTEGLAYGRVDGSVLMDEDLCEAALTVLVRNARATLLVLDSQRGLWKGDEKEAREIRAMYERLSRLAERLDIGILLLHHDARHGSNSGSTDQNASVQSRLHLERKNPKVKKDRWRVLSQEKNRAAEEEDPYTFKIHVDGDGITFERGSDEAAEDSPSTPAPARRFAGPEDVAATLEKDGPELASSTIVALTDDLSDTRLREMYKRGELAPFGIVRTGSGTATRYQIIKGSIPHPAGPPTT